MKREKYQFLFTMVFTHKNFYRHMDEKITLFGKDIGYRFLNNPNSNWRLFMLKLATAIINTFLEPLTRSDHTKVLIVDDSLFSRNRSKKVELLAKVFDHTQHRYFKGFRKLTVGWSDGASFIPLAFSLLSSKDPKNRLYEQGPTVPEHSPGNARILAAVLAFLVMYFWAANTNADMNYSSLLWFAVLVAGFEYFFHNYLKRSEEVAP